jgi:hypothetical protein
MKGGNKETRKPDYGDSDYETEEQENREDGNVYERGCEVREGCEHEGVKYKRL